MIRCRFCSSENIVKNGIRKNKYQTKQTYKCKCCNKQFVVDDGFIKKQFPPEIITASLDLWAKGISLEKIQDHFVQFHDIRISCATILNWLREYGSKIKKYTDNLKYDLSGLWTIDESMVSFNGNYNWLWNIMHKDKKFLISSRFSVLRWKKHSDMILNEGKLKTTTMPDIVHTDGFMSYPGSVEEIFDGETEHMRHTMKSKPSMNIVERMNGICKDRLKPMRGFRNVFTANQTWILWVGYYNFIKPHHSLGMITPAEACGVDLKLDNNKWLSLIQSFLED